MIEESYISFDTAFALKNAGFDEVCSSQYFGTGSVVYTQQKNSKLSPGYVSRPTQAMAIRWLLERHGIFIEDYILVNGQFAYRLFRNGRNLVSEQSDMYESLQGCIEDALQEALRLIIKNKDNEQTNN